MSQTAKQLIAREATSECMCPASAKRASERAGPPAADKLRQHVRRGQCQRGDHPPPVARSVAPVIVMMVMGHQAPVVRACSIPITMTSNDAN